MGASQSLRSFRIWAVQNHVNQARTTVNVVMSRVQKPFMTKKDVKLREIFDMQSMSLSHLFQLVSYADDAFQAAE